MSSTTVNRRTAPPPRHSASLEGLEKVVPPRVMSFTAHRSEFHKPTLHNKSSMGADTLNTPSEYSVMYSDSSETASTADDSSFGTPNDPDTRSYPILVRTGSDDFTGLIDLPVTEDHLKNSPPSSPLPFIHPLSVNTDRSEKPPKPPASPFNLDLSTSIFGTAAPRKGAANPLKSHEDEDEYEDDDFHHSTMYSGYNSGAPSPALASPTSDYDREHDSAATSPTEDCDASSIILGTSAHYGRPIQWSDNYVSSAHASHYFRDKKWDYFPELATPQDSGRSSPNSGKNGKEGRLNVTAKQPKWYSIQPSKKGNGVRDSFMTYMQKLSHHNKEDKEKEEEKEKERPLPQLPHNPIDVPRVHARRFTSPYGPLNAHPTNDSIPEDEEETQELDEFHAQLKASSTSSSGSFASYEKPRETPKVPRDRKSACPPSNSRKHASFSWQLPAKNKMRSSQPPPSRGSPLPSAMKKPTLPSAMRQSQPPPPVRQSTAPIPDNRRNNTVSWQLPAKSKLRSSEPPPVPSFRSNRGSQTMVPSSRPVYSKTPRPQGQGSKQTPVSSKRSTFAAFNKKFSTDDAAERRREEIRSRIKLVGSVNPHLCKPQKDPWSPHSSTHPTPF